MYEQPPRPTEEFLAITYKMMIKKVERLIEIDNSMKRKKLPLPLLKEKYEIVSNLMEALRLLINYLDYDTDLGKILAERYNEIGTMLSLGTLDHDKRAYEDVVIKIKVLLGNS